MSHYPSYEPYLTQSTLHWPPEGRYVYGHVDHERECILVYQAYNNQIADAAVQDQRLGGGGFSENRMTWIKPNFLWMMYRCGWATKDANQTRVLGFYLKLDAFFQLLRLASFEPAAGPVKDPVRIQWDPDHGPEGVKHPFRKALQLGLRGDGLRIFREGTVEVVDMTPELEKLKAGVEVEGRQSVLVPVERVVPVDDEELRKRLRMAEFYQPDKQ
ncbi:hypothetical protein HK104_003188 [Borealophlyctis nickersoniae]|nr:hypothetical protein HK104_003188 [Borealophlyctis nickersoniae]